MVEEVRILAIAERWVWGVGFEAIYAVIGRKIAIVDRKCISTVCGLKIRAFACALICIVSIVRAVDSEALLAVCGHDSSVVDEGDTMASS